MADLPHGYRIASASGLLLPDALSRAREVWTRDEARLLDRATKLIEARGLALYLQCPHPDCVHMPIEPSRGGDGALILRCAHKERILSTRI